MVLICDYMANEFIVVLRINQLLQCLEFKVAHPFADACVKWICG